MDMNNAKTSPEDKHAIACVRAYFTPKFIVYALQDPQTQKVRYIGMSTKGLVRPKRHLYTQTNPHMRNWIHSLKKQGLRPNIIILEWLNTQWAALEMEKLYIKAVRSPDLLNYTGGGDGRLGVPAANKGRPCPDWLKKRIGDANRGRKASEHTRRLMSLARTGKKQSSEVVAKRVKAAIAANVKPIRDQNGFLYGSVLEAARHLGLQSTHIVRVLKGKQKNTKGYTFTYEVVSNG